MEYEPIEGVDYLVDLYAVANIDDNATQEDIKRAIKERMKEYHPDRLEGLAPEFRAKGERMGRLLTRAKVILLNPQARDEYDDMLISWHGPISDDGTPVVTIGRATRAEASMKSPEEIEAGIIEMVPKIESMTGYSASQLSFLERMIEMAEDDIPADLAQAYEEALLSQDRALAIEEANRGDLLSLPNMENTRYVATLDYAESKAVAIESARTAYKEELVMAALGGVSTRLAILSGESAPESSTTLVRTESIDVPSYFDEQALKIKEIAKKRQVIVEKRLANFNPTYPEAELQTEAKPLLALRFSSVWFGFVVDADERAVNSVDIPREVAELLNKENYAAAIDSGFNVITVEPLDQIDFHELIGAVVDKYVDKYGLLPDNE